MVDLCKLKSQVLASDRIGDREVECICRELYADARLDRDVVEFLAAVRREARTVCPSFEQLFADAVKLNVMVGGSVTSEGVAWLRHILVADRGIDECGKKLLWDLKRQILHPCREFRKLYEECVD